MKQLFAVAVPVEDELGQLLHKHDFWKTIQIRVRMCRQTEVWVTRVQQRNEKTEAFNEDQQQLNLQKNYEGIYM